MPWKPPKGFAQGPFYTNVKLTVNGPPVTDVFKQSGEYTPYGGVYEKIRGQGAYAPYGGLFEIKEKEPVTVVEFALQSRPYPFFIEDSITYNHSLYFIPALSAVDDIQYSSEILGILSSGFVYSSASFLPESVTYSAYILGATVAFFGYESFSFLPENLRYSANIENIISFQFGILNYSNWPAEKIRYGHTITAM